MAASEVSLDLSTIPLIYISATHLETQDLRQIKDELIANGALLTDNIDEAGVIISKAEKRARILFDLRSLNVYTRDVENEALCDEPVSLSAERPKKRRRISQADRASGRDALTAISIDDQDSSTQSDGESTSIPFDAEDGNLARAKGSADEMDEAKLVRVIKFDWFQKSKRAHRLLPLSQFTTYLGRRTHKPVDTDDVPPSTPSTNPKTPDRMLSTPRTLSKDSGSAILKRAREDALGNPSPSADRLGRRRFGQPQSVALTGASWSAGTKNVYAHLLQQTTTEEESGYSSEIPDMPAWVKAGIKYACQRATPKDSPNFGLIKLLKQIRLARMLTDDEIGVRAYSTSIAAIAAYPYKISNPREIIALPGCEAKIANLFVEWSNTGQMQPIIDFEGDPNMKVLRTFYDIWGVGAVTAREFYYDRGWQDLDDIVEYGWSTLTRVQQIGVKFYEEFQKLIPRDEVARIGSIVHGHAVRVRDDRIQSLLVGGYRRGKEASGDVDVIISHPDETQTANIINDLVQSLEDEGWITHTLTLSMNNTRREQQTLPFRASSMHGGRSFDSLDKALVVWQDPFWPDQEAAQAKDANAKNPNIHRRVDIIISPWRTVGCAVVGWSGATTFERDLRRYAKNVKGWKFDSSGVRSRGTGQVIDLEGYYSWNGLSGEAGRAKTMLEAEKRVFQGFGLEYREPWDRCTE